MIGEYLFNMPMLFLAGAMMSDMPAPTNQAA
jgi:hypothetical protein